MKGVCSARTRAVATVIALGLIVACLSGCALGSPSSPSSTSGSSARLPFQLPPPAQLKAAARKAFAHYLPSFPISIDNKAPEVDYYSAEYLSPTGEGGRHAAYGGLLRDRPLAQAPLGTSNWALENMKTEVRRATTAGLDGFTVDVLDLDGATWDRVNLLFSAAPMVDSEFKLVLMPDAAALEGVDADKLADAMASLARSPAAFRLPDGRVVVSPFDPERLGIDFWQRFLTRMKSQGLDVAFVPCFLDYEHNVSAFADVSYGFGDWGSRSPAANEDLAANVQDAHARGKIWMQPVSVQDERPSQGVYDEANNSENLRLTWQAAIDDGADWVQMATWNDYSESTQFAPSALTGWAPLDVSSYFLGRFKTGNWPRLIGDAIYVSYRAQPSDAIPTGGQTRLMRLRTGSSPARDKLEVLSFLNGPATIRVDVGGESQTYAAAAGVSARLFDLKAGSHSVTVVRQGLALLSVSSQVATTVTPQVQNLEYLYVSSAGRGS